MSCRASSRWAFAKRGVVYYRSKHFYDRDRGLSWVSLINGALQIKSTTGGGHSRANVEDPLHLQEETAYNSVVKAGHLPSRDLSNEATKLLYKKDF